MCPHLPSDAVLCDLLAVVFKSVRLAFMNRCFSILLMMSVMLLSSSCALQKSAEVTADLWNTWEQAEEQMQQNFPDAPPLILVHGWNGDESTWPAPERLIELENLLQRDVYMFTYRTAIYPNRFPPLEVVEEQFTRYIAPYEQVDVIAHSMGGLLVRHYLADHDENPIRRVVFLATPHFGSNAARLLMGLGSALAEGNIQANEIQPGSDFLWQLNVSQGSELEHVQVLNVFIQSDRLIKRDLVVTAASSYLPWASNIVVDGPHHSLGERLMQLPRLLDFIRDGRLPIQLVSAPSRQDAWLRFRVNGVLVKLSANNFKAYDAKGVPSRDFKLCCTLRSGLYGEAGLDSVVIEKLQSGFSYHFRASLGSRSLIVKSDDLMQTKLPVMMKEFDVEDTLSQPKLETHKAP